MPTTRTTESVLLCKIRIRMLRCMSLLRVPARAKFSGIEGEQTIRKSVMGSISCLQYKSFLPLIYRYFFCLYPHFIRKGRVPVQAKQLRTGRSQIREVVLSQHRIWFVMATAERRSKQQQEVTSELVECLMNQTQAFDRLFDLPPTFDPAALAPHVANTTDKRNLVFNFYAHVNAKTYRCKKCKSDHVGLQDYCVRTPVLTLPFFLNALDTFSFHSRLLVAADHAAPSNFMLKTCTYVSWVFISISLLPCFRST